MHACATWQFDAADAQLRITSFGDDLINLFGRSATTVASTFYESFDARCMQPRLALENPLVLVVVYPLRLRAM